MRFLGALCVCSVYYTGTVRISWMILLSLIWKVSLLKYQFLIGMPILFHSGKKIVEIFPKSFSVICILCWVRNLKLSYSMNIEYTPKFKHELHSILILQNKNKNRGSLYSLWRVLFSYSLIGYETVWCRQFVLFKFDKLMCEYVLWSISLGDILRLI